MRTINSKILWTLVMIPVALAWIMGLFIDVTGDSGLYSAIVRQMVDSGDWFNLNFAGIPYQQKPHLFFWLAGLGVQLLGNSNLAFKLFPFLYGLGGIYFTYRLGRLIFSEQEGRIAALLVATSQIYFLYFFDLHTDTVLQTSVMLALWQLAEYLVNKKWFSFYLAFVGVGLAMLSKGPFGAVLPFFAVIFYLIVKKDYRLLFHPKWIIGILIAFSVILPTLYQLYSNFGTDGLKFFFVTNNVGRITGTLTGTNNDYSFYLHTLLWTFLPWTFMVVPSIFSTIKSWFTKNNQKPWTIFLLGGVLILTSVLSCSKGKAPNYFLVSIAPIALITAWWFNYKILNSEKKSRILSRLQWILAGAQFIFFVALIFILGINNPAVAIILLIIAVFLSVLVLQNKDVGFNKVFIINVLMISMLNLYINLAVLPELFSYQGARQVLEKFELETNQKKQLYMFDLEDYNLFYYSKQKVYYINDWEKLYKAMETPGSWIYTSKVKYNEIKGMQLGMDKVYEIRNRRMNKITLRFLNPNTRELSLDTNYLIVTGNEKSE